VTATARRHLPRDAYAASRGKYRASTDLCSVASWTFSGASQTTCWQVKSECGLWIWVKRSIVSNEVRSCRALTLQWPSLTHQFTVTVRQSTSTSTRCPRTTTSRRRSDVCVLDYQWIHFRHRDAEIRRCRTLPRASPLSTRTNRRYAIIILAYVLLSLLSCCFCRRWWQWWRHWPFDLTASRDTRPLFFLTMWFLPCDKHGLCFCVVSVRLSVRPSILLGVRHVRVLCQNELHYPQNFFHRLQDILVFPTKPFGNNPTGTSLTGYWIHGVWKISIFDQYVSLSRKWYKIGP